MTFLNLKIKIFTSILLTFTTINLFSQTKIFGKVLDKEKNAIPFANILLKTENNNAILAFTYTDVNGDYVINTNTVGILKLNFSSLGYKAVEANVTILADTKVIEKNVIIDNLVNELNEVIINVRKPITIKQDTIIFDVKSFLQGNEHILEDLLKKIPGLTVGIDGSVKVGNQEIEKIMVEGEDMFEKGYKILSKNMPVYPIEKIELLQHYANNKHLKGIENSEKVALNVILKEDFKRKWFGNSEFGYGLSAENRYDAQVNLMNFGKKDKYYFLTNANTIAKDATGDINHLIYSNKAGDGLEIGDNQSLEPIIGLNSETPNLNKKRVDFNVDKMLSLNSIFTVSPKLKLKVLGFLNSTQNDFNKSDFHSYIIGQANFSNYETFQIRKNNLLGLGKLNLIYDISKTETFEYKAVINTSTENGQSNLNFNGNLINENLVNKNKLDDHQIVYTSNFKEKKALIISGRYLYQNIPQDYSVNQFIFQNLFSEDANRTEQVTGNKFNFLGFEAHLLDRKKNGDLLEVRLGNEYREDNVSSNFRLLKNELLVGEPLLYQNKLKFSVNDIYFKNKYVIKLNKVNLVTQLDMHQLFSTKIDLNDENSQTPFYLNPRIGLNWMINDKNKIISLYSRNVSNVTVLDVYKGYIQTGFRNFQRGNNQLDQLSSSTLFLNYNFSSANSRFFINSNILITHNNDFFSSNSIIKQNYIQSSKILIKNQNVSNFSSNVEYYLKNISTNLKFTISGSNTNYKNIINGSELRNVQSKNLINALELRSGFSGVFNYNLGAKWSNFQIETIATNSYTNNMIFFDASFVFSNKFNFQIQTERYYFDNIGSVKNKYYFLDFNTQYNLKENKLTLSLSGNNLLNTKSFSNYSVSDTDVLNTEFSLVRRYFLLKAEYRF